MQEYIHFFVFDPDGNCIYKGANTGTQANTINALGDENKKAGGYTTDTKYVSKICSIIERFGLDKYDGTQSTEVATEVQPVDTVIASKEYVVQAGAFKYKKNAKTRLSEVKKLGGDFKKAFITKSGENYVVQTGVFSVEGNARAMEAVLETSGIEACVKER